MSVGQSIDRCHVGFVCLRDLPRLHEVAKTVHSAQTAAGSQAVADYSSRSRFEIFVRSLFRSLAVVRSFSEEGTGRLSH